MSKREPKCVRKANKQCRKFHKGLDDALAAYPDMLTALGRMDSECMISGRGTPQYEFAYTKLADAKRLASYACRQICEELEGGGIEVQSGAGK